MYKTSPAHCTRTILLTRPISLTSLYYLSEDGYPGLLFSVNESSG